MSFDWLKRLFDSRLKAAYTFMRTIGLDNSQVSKVVDAVVAVRDSDMPGPEKAKKVSEVVSAEHNLPEHTMECLSTIVQVAWLIAKLSGKL